MTPKVSIVLRWRSQPRFGTDPWPATRRPEQTLHIALARFFVPESLPDPLPHPRCESNPPPGCSSQKLFSGSCIAEYNVEFLAGDSRQIESLFDLASQIAIGHGKPQVQFLDLRRIVIDDKYWFVRSVRFDFSVHCCHSFFRVCFMPANCLRPGEPGTHPFHNCIRLLLGFDCPCAFPFTNCLVVVE